MPSPPPPPWQRDCVCNSFDLTDSVTSCNNRPTFYPYTGHHELLWLYDGRLARCCLVQTQHGTYTVWWWWSYPLPWRNKLLQLVVGVTPLKSSDRLKLCGPSEVLNSYVVHRYMVHNLSVANSRCSTTQYFRYSFFLTMWKKAMYYTVLHNEWTDLPSYFAGAQNISQLFTLQMVTYVMSYAS